MAGCTAASVPAVALGSDLEVALLATSDWMYHGTTETRGEPAAGVAIDWQINAHVFAGAEIHQAVVDGDPQRHRSTRFYAGAGTPLSNRWFLSGSLSHREFPGGRKEWGITEVDVQLDGRLGDRGRLRLNADYSPDYYAHNTQAVSLEGRYLVDLHPHWYCYASLGAIEFERDSVISDYRFGSVGVGARWRGLTVDLSWRGNSAGADESFGLEALSDSKVVAEVSWRLR